MSIALLRGIEWSDIDYSFLIINENIENVSRALCKLKGDSRITRNIYERAIDLNGFGFIIFQFSGHSWTIVQNLNVYGYDGYGSDSRALSTDLQTHALSYVFSDVTFSQHYELYESGILLEKLVCEQENIIDFQSLLRDSYKDTTWSLDEFLYENDAYIPALVWPEHLIEPERNVADSSQENHKFSISGYTSETTQLYTFQPSDFLRVDYLAIE